MSKRRRAWNAYYSGANPKTILKGALLAWYRADLGITLNGSNVSGWADQSGNGDANRNATQGTGANQPTFTASSASYAGRPVVTYTSTAGCCLVTGTWSAAMVQPVTLFVVGHTTVGTNQYACDSLNSGAQMAINNLGSNVGIFAGSQLASGVAITNVPAFCYGIFNGATSKVAVNAKTAQGSGAAGANGAAGLTLGNWAGQSLPMTGPMAELFVASGVPSAATIAALAGYVSTRYGLVIGA